MLDMFYVIGSLHKDASIHTVVTDIIYPISLLYGVPERSILGPILFSLCSLGRCDPQTWYSFSLLRIYNIVPPC